MDNAGARSKSQGNLLKQVRQLHLYLGTFFAPAILLFSVTGLIQLLGLHEGHPGSDYQPPALILRLSQIHIHQTSSLPPVRRPPAGVQRPPSERRPEGGPGGPPPQRGLTVAVKGFFLLMSLGLILTTCLGVYMAFKYNRSRPLVWGLLALGTVLPALFLLL